jgi:DnaJ homolog subfamily C member 9
MTPRKDGSPKPGSDGTRSCLYEILGVEKTATEIQIRKAYRVRALQFHPDKNPSEDAKSHFQKLVTAYNILKAADSRKMYDETEYIDGKVFDKAAEFFRTKFGRISEQDIDDFQKVYKNSSDEIDDVVKFYSQHSGDVSHLLEWIPLSEPDEVDRFLSMIDSLISDKTISECPAYTKSIPKLRKNAKKMKKDQSKFDENNNPSDLNALTLAIKQRQANSEDFFDSLIAKYAKKQKTK